MNPWGSSPPVRGALHILLLRLPGTGLIPAHVGNTTISLPFWRGFQAHPRLCREHAFFATESPAGRGSSPLARGTPEATCGAGASAGLIPACAGSTMRRSVVTRLRGAHPRSRGDHTPASNAGTNELGSSPLARGPQRVEWSPGLRVGLIPARAGTTAGINVRNPNVRAHPRSRGDHICMHGTPPCRRGSSPLARGPPAVQRRKTAGTGLIPARAGTTRRLDSNSAMRRAHPRSRGDHSRRVCTAG